jgi:hypothetical protein
MLMKKPFTDAGALKMIGDDTRVRLDKQNDMYACVCVCVCVCVYIVVAVADQFDPP